MEIKYFLRQIVCVCFFVVDCVYETFKPIYLLTVKNYEKGKREKIIKTEKNKIHYHLQETYFHFIFHFIPYSPLLPLSDCKSFSGDTRQYFYCYDITFFCVCFHSLNWVVCTESTNHTKKKTIMCITNGLVSPLFM